MDNPRIIGHVASVNGFRVKVELLKDARSASRATPDGVHTAVAINAYLTFSIGAGVLIIGQITDLEARETYDPSSDDELSLELLKARRVASVQLLGVVEEKGSDWVFNPGISVLPTLDTPAEVGSPKILAAVFERPPQRNQPDDSAVDYDFDLVLGFPTGQRENKVKASYNDLFSRPLAIVGNTGSGKSYSVASLLQKAMAELGSNTINAPHIFILDINGEYGRSFLPETAKQRARQPDHIYLNGEEFGIPIWFFNAQEICAWLSASEQTQEPVLKDWWAMSKARNERRQIAGDNSILHALTKADFILQCLDDNKGGRKFALCTYLKIIKEYLAEVTVEGLTELETALQPHKSAPSSDWTHPANETDIRTAVEKLILNLRTMASKNIEVTSSTGGTADSPLLVRRGDLQDPTLINRSVSQEDQNRIEGHLTTLKLRLKTRLDDKRWKSFLNYEETGTTFSKLEEWINRFGFFENDSLRVSVIDLSMLSHEALPYACGIIGRMLLEIRERLPANERYNHPWVLVLEEAHNYARPARTTEDRGQALSRAAFERIAKEGRKFGLSLVVASQRPSEISPTIVSQCANFVSHRLQNPDDIEHFRRIIPSQAKRLLDQVTVLASGEAIVFGSAFHIPTRVQIDMPAPAPWSQTAAPYYRWKNQTTSFPLATVLTNWGMDLLKKEPPAASPPEPEADDQDDDIPF